VEGRDDGDPVCFDADSVPPIPPISGGSVDHADLVLEASDGNRFAAFAATAGGRTGIVVLPDVRGLYRFYEELALRFAERGYDAIAIDYFGRTAGVGKRDDEFDFMDHVARTTFAGIRSDVAAAVEYLRADDPDRPVFTVGFCFGGSNSWHQAANGLDISGAVGFYGHPDRPNFPVGALSLMDRIDDVDCPILGLMGGADPSIPVATIDRFRDALTDAGVGNEMIVYPDAPHSFFDRKYDEFAAASADAWDRVLAFVGTA
jgi:carboxymethylenebutenolidase